MKENKSTVTLKVFVDLFSRKTKHYQLEKAISEGIGSFKAFLPKTSAQQSYAEGKGINEAIAGLESQFVLTTRNAEGEQCYDERDCVTVEIRNRQGQDCATEAHFQDNKDGSYKISHFAKETGKAMYQ